MKTKLFYLFALSVLSIGFWLQAGSLFNKGGLSWPVILALAAWLLLSSLLLAGMKLKHSRWIYANLIVLAVIPLLPFVLSQVLPGGFSSLGYGLIALTYPITALASVLFYVVPAWKRRPAGDALEEAGSPPEGKQPEWAAILPVLSALTLVCGLTLRLMWGGGGLSGFLHWLVALGIVLLSVPALVLAAKEIRVNGLVLAGLFSLALLCLPDSLYLGLTRAEGWELFSSQHAITLLLLYSLALVVLALLLQAGLNLLHAPRKPGAQEHGERPVQPPWAGRNAALVFVLGCLLLARTLYDLYWFMVWDATTDPLEYFWLAVPVPVVLLSGAVLCIVLPGRKKLAGLLYMLLLPALMVGVTALAQRLDFRQLTADRAERVTQALEKYYAREGHYPATLQQLTPRYLLSLSRPVIIYGQGWCYQGGGGYYRLGYLDREHWSSPIRFGRLHATQGQSPAEEQVCQPALDAFQAQHPDWGQVLQDYGQPTPTPDLGD